MRNLVLVFMLALTAGARAQLFDPAQFAVEQRRVSDTELEIIFTATIDDGWHMYGTEVTDGSGTAAELTIETSRGASPKGKLRAAAPTMEHTARFTQRFTLTAPEYAISGRLTYGVCCDGSCLPPADVPFAFEGKGASVADEQTSRRADETSEPASDEAVEAQTDTTDTPQPTFSSAEDISSAQASPSAHTSLLTIFLLGLLGGLAALVTPCVWPIIPMTVSYFIKRGRGLRDAAIYGASIVIIYMALGMAVTLAFGASALNSLSTNAAFNIFFFLMLVVFGASFLGGFDITLPSRWSNAVDSRAGRTSGLPGIFLMAFTLSLVSFSCTGPIIGFLLVEAGTGGGMAAPAVGMLGFSLALALPFTLFALFPSWMKRAPKSGSWMNRVKVSLGFVELAFSLKFLSVADLAYGWHLLDREVFLSLWIVLFALWGCYLMGWVRFPHDEDEDCRTSVPRFFMALAAFAFALYMVPGLWGAPCRAVSAFAPPLSTQDFNLSPASQGAHFTDYDEGMAYARANGKRVLLDFTGHGCVNCRKMEAAVWTDARVQRIMERDYVVISLYVDDKTPLPQPMTVTENGTQRTLRTVGDKWSYLQRSRFAANAQPFYVITDHLGQPLAQPYTYNEDPAAYAAWLALPQSF